MTRRESMLGSLHSTRQSSSSYHESRRRETERDCDPGYSSQEHYERERDRDREYRYRSRSRSPPPRAPTQPSGHGKQPLEPPHQKTSSQTSRPESQRRRFEAAATEPIGEGANRISQLRKDFPNICFDDLIFLPHLKKIPAKAEQTMHDYIHDFYSQYREWMKTAEKASTVAFERAKTIEKLETELAQKDSIIQVLNDEAESSWKSKMEATQKADEANLAVERMRQTHYAFVEEMGHRNTTVKAERDAALRELEELKARLSEITKEKDVVNKAVQEACEQAVVLRGERDAASAKIREVEAKVEDEVKMAESRLEADIEDLLITYNANVLKHRNLAWLNNYPTHMYNVWGRLVEDEKAEHQGESIDEFELKNRMLNEDERKVLHDTMITYGKEKLVTQPTEVREGSVEEEADEEAEEEATKDETKI